MWFTCGEWRDYHLSDTLEIYTTFLQEAKIPCCQYKLQLIFHFLFFAVTITVQPSNESELQLYRVLQRANLLTYFDTFIAQGKNKRKHMHMTIDS